MKQHILGKTAPKKASDSTYNLFRSVDFLMQKTTPTTLQLDHADYQIMGMIARPIQQPHSTKQKQ
ncbi:MAG: hypothetical protein ABI378_01655 [Chitinophagaceae bacterium]